MIDNAFHPIDALPQLSGHFRTVAISLTTPAAPGLINCVIVIRMMHAQAVYYKYVNAIDIDRSTDHVPT